MKTKLSLLVIFAATAALFLGGKVCAQESADVQIQAITVEEAAAQVQSLKEKVSALTVEIQNSQFEPPVVTTTTTALTQEQIDQISSKLNVIAEKVRQLKVQVEIFVKVREIENKIAAIRIQIAALQSGNISTSQAQIAASTETTATQAQTAQQTEMTDTEKEARIAQIKQQISELNQELETKKAAEAQNSMAASDESCGEGEVCQAGTSEIQQPVEVEILPKSEKAETTSPNFWTSIGNFLKKLFTF